MFNFFNSSKILLILVFLPFPVFARCAVCYTKGLSGASIAVIVIVLSALLLFIANKVLQKFFDTRKEGLDYMSSLVDFIVNRVK